jgi:hypothetical protein
MGMDDRIDSTCPVQRRRVVFQFWTGTFLVIISGCSELTRIPRRFAQILSLFIAVPPFLQVCQLAPQLWLWAINLTWIACCWRRKRRGGKSVPAGEPDIPNKSLYYTDLEGSVLLEGRDGRFYEGREEMQRLVMIPEPNRYSGSP